MSCKGERPIRSYRAKWNSALSRHQQGKAWVRVEEHLDAMAVQFQGFALRAQANLQDWDEASGRSFVFF
jgi:hypothetical protein